MRVPNFLVRHIFEPLWDNYERSNRLSTLRKLRRAQFDDLETVVARQNAKLNTIVRHAASTCPFYAERFKAAGIDPASVHNIADLQDLPLLTKADIRANPEGILSSNFRKEDLIPAKTGGSTGVSLEIFCDLRGIQTRHGVAILADEWSGWCLGQPMAAVWGNPPVPGTFKEKVRSTFKDRFIYLDTMKIDDEAIDQFLIEWRQIRPGMLYGHAHSIFILAENLLERGIKVVPPSIVATSMMLIDSERRVIEEAFDAKVTNRYGCEEVSLISCECEQHRGLHLNSEHIIVEFLRDDGSPCDDGEDGRLVITELINFGMPMIRYEIGDRGIPTSRKCPCGRGWPLMEEVTGRVADFLYREDRSRIAGISLIENTLTRFEGIRQLQIIQDKLLTLQINLVPGRTYTPDVNEKLTAALREMMGSSFAVEITLVEAIAQEKSGKYRFTICRV